MTRTDGTADEAAIEEDAGVEDGAAIEDAADEDEGPPYSRLDEETAAKCGLWLE